MAWGEGAVWLAGSRNEDFYEAWLEESANAPEIEAGRRKVLHPPDLPWEMSRQGILKHLLHEGLNTRMDTVDAYLQVIPPASRSGRHRHLAEECLYVVEGHGFDLHQDCDVDITDVYTWVPQEEVRCYKWDAGDVIYVPPNTIHQHVNADPERPVRLVSATNRIYRKCGLGDIVQLEDAPEYRPGVRLTDELVRGFLSRPAG